MAWRRSYDVPPPPLPEDRWVYIYTYTYIYIYICVGGGEGYEICCHRIIGHGDKYVYVILLHHHVVRLALMMYVSLCDIM
jgi:hypothetical protein